MLKSLPLLLSALAAILPAQASLYQKLGPGRCHPETSPAQTYPSLIHHSVATPQSCSETCDSTNSKDAAAWPYYRGFAHGEGECYCYYDAGRLPVAVEGRTWTREEGGDGQGEIGGGDGAEGVACFKVIVRETFPILAEKAELFPDNNRNLRH